LQLFGSECERVFNLLFLELGAGQSGFLHWWADHRSVRVSWTGQNRYWTGGL